MPTRKPNPPTIERKVYFYRYSVHPDDDGNGQLPDPLTICQAVDCLSFETRDRYLDVRDGHEVCVWPMHTCEQARLCLGYVRRSGLPYIEDTGNVLPLEIAAHQGLLELSHVVFFPDGIVGVEFNFYGPRLSRLGTYLREKCRDLPPLTFEMLLNHDVQEQLTHVRDLRLLQLRLRRDYSDLLEEAGQSVPAALRALEEHVGATEIEIILRQPWGARRGLGERALDLVKTLAGEPRTREGAEVFKIRGFDDRTRKVESFDLLKDQLVSTRHVIRQHLRHRAVDSESMFAEINTAFNQLAPSIRRAAGIET